MWGRRTVAATLLKIAFGGLLATTLVGCVGDILYATNVTPTSADVVFSGNSSTGSIDYYVEYGTTIAYGQTTPTRSITVQANTWATGYEPLAGLTADTVYHYRLCGKEHSGSAFACAGDHGFKTATFSNPVSRCYGFSCAFDVRIGDPTAFRDPNGSYYLTGSGPLSLHRSDDLSGGWAYLRDMAGDSNKPTNMDLAPDPQWLSANNAQAVPWWGSELRRVGSFYVAVTTGNAAASFQSGKGRRGAIFVGTIPTSGSVETDTLAWQADPIVYSPDGSEQYYDPSVFADAATGKVWLVWASWRNGTFENVTRIYAIQIALHASGTPVTLASGKTQSSRVQLLAATATQGNREQAFSNLWIVEGPGLVSNGSNYWLYYAAGGEAYSTSGGNFANYSFNLSQPRSTFPGAFAKQSAAKLSTTPDVGTYRSPGHGGMLQDAAGNWWLMFHTHDANGRMVWAQQMYFDLGANDFSMVQGGGTIQQDGNYAPVP